MSSMYTPVVSWEGRSGLSWESNLIEVRGRKDDVILMEVVAKYGWLVASFGSKEVIQKAVKSCYVIVLFPSSQGSGLIAPQLPVWLHMHK